MFNSVITINEYLHEEMLIPKTIGTPHKGYASKHPINRLLPVGHRYHGYEA